MFTVDKQRKITDIVMLIFVRVAVQRTEKSVYLNMVNKRRYRMGPRAALSIDNDFDPA